MLLRWSEFSCNTYQWALNVAQCYVLSLLFAQKSFRKLQLIPDELALLDVSQTLRGSLVNCSNRFGRRRSSNKYVAVLSCECFNCALESKRRCNRALKCACAQALYVPMLHELHTSNAISLVYESILDVLLPWIKVFLTVPTQKREIAVLTKTALGYRRYWRVLSCDRRNFFVSFDQFLRHLFVVCMRKSVQIWFSWWS